jgi:hypothetical protein
MGSLRASLYKAGKEAIEKGRQYYSLPFFNKKKQEVKDNGKRYIS